jgi:hypothetical protein
VPLLGWDLPSQLKAQILFPPGNYLCCPLLHEEIDSTVWIDGMTAGQTKTALLIKIKLKDPSQFPHQKQYPLKPEGQQGLLPIINSLRKIKIRATNQLLQSLQFSYSCCLKRTR